MSNELICSLYFQPHRTSVAVLEMSDNGFSLRHLQHLTAIINLDDSADGSATALELCDLLEHLDGTLHKVFVTISSEYSLLTHIPAVEKDSLEFLELLDLEVRTHFPDRERTDFYAKVTPLGVNGEMNLVSLIDKELLVRIEKIVSNLGVPLTDVNVAPFASINSFSYNYPELRNKYVMLVEVCKDAIEYIMMYDNRIIMYEYDGYSSDADLADKIEMKVGSMSSRLGVALAGMYFYGETLSREQYISCWEIGMILAADSKRLNPFRMMDTSLEQRDREYISRTFQMYTQCIGGGLPTQLDVVVR